MNNYLLIVPGVMLAGVAALWPKKKSPVSDEPATLVTRFSDRIAAPPSITKPTSEDTLLESDEAIQAHTEPPAFPNMDAAVQEVLSDLRVSDVAAPPHATPWSSERSVPTDEAIDQVKAAVDTVAHTVGTDIAQPPYTLAATAAVDHAVPAWPAAEPEPPALADPEVLHDEFDEAHDDVPAEETGTFIPSWRPPVENEDDDQVYFGAQPLTQAERDAARERWILQNGGVEPPLPAAAPIEPEPAITSVPWGSSDAAESANGNEPAGTSLASDIAAGMSVGEAVARLVSEASSGAYLSEAYTALPEYRSALVRALDGIPSTLSLPTLALAVREVRSPDVAWTALSLLKQLRGSSDAYGDVIESALNSEPGVAARAATMLLGDAPLSDYEEFVQARVERAHAEAILALVSPVVAA